jgi:hypothetical protein
MRNRHYHEPTLANILEEVRQLREDLKSRNRALLTVPEAAAFLGIPEKSVRNRLGPKATDPFPVTPVRLGAIQQKVREKIAEEKATFDTSLPPATGWEFAGQLYPRIPFPWEVLLGDIAESLQKLGRACATW